MACRCQVMIIMVSNELRPVDKSHRHSQPRVTCGRSDVSVREFFEHQGQRVTLSPERLEYVSDRDSTVASLHRAAVGRVSGGECLVAREELLHALNVQRVQIAQVPEVLFDRPRTKRLRREALLRNAGHESRGASGRPPKPLQHGGEGAYRKVEAPASFYPGYESHHVRDGTPKARDLRTTRR